ncbi:MAG TPA: hypothetical protein VJ767_07065 [Nitrososphaeraceae archaeon]|nr:hypothetical protein [Nitrososphaeraceae archaeon]
MVLTSTTHVFAQNASQDVNAVGSIEELEKLTGDNPLENFSFVESIGNTTETIVNATASALANITSNQTDAAQNLTK